MLNKKIWIFGKNTVFSCLYLGKRKIFEIQILNKILLHEIDKKFHSKCKLVSEKEFLKKLDIDIAHQGIAACVEEKPNIKIENITGNAIILDNIYDHRNIGSIIRTSIAFGINNLIVDKRNFSSSSPLMYKTASGAIENMNFFQVSNISNTLMWLKNNHYSIIAFDGSGEENIYANNKVFEYKKIAFVFGSEDKGLRELTKKRSDFIIKIPISNIESLNVSAAVSSVLTMYNYFIRSNESKKSFENS